jgi:ProP effector
MSHNAILAVISLLAEKWPCCFSIIEPGRRPLKRGIREDVLAALGGAISAGKVSAALRWYVSSPEYQRWLVHGAWRVDLNGKPAGIVSQEDEAHARAQLAAIEAKRAKCASASSNSAPALNLGERIKQTSQARAAKCSASGAFAAKADDAPSAREAPYPQGRAQKATGRGCRAAVNQEPTWANSSMAGTLTTMLPEKRPSDIQNAICRFVPIAS